MSEARRSPPPAPARPAGVATLLLVLVAAIFPTRELGGSAIFGRAWLWGESSSRIYRGAGTVWFVDGMEVLQHALFGLQVIWALALIGGSHHTRTNAANLGLLLALDLWRGHRVDGSSTLALSGPMFWLLVVGWGLLGLVRVPPGPPRPAKRRPRTEAR